MTYIVSDIHGEYDLFIKLLEKINFSNSDTIIICGDVVDKGIDSVKLLQYVLSKPNIKMIIGNHEYDFLKKYWALMQNALPNEFDKVLQELKSYFVGDGYLLDWDTIDALESLPFFIEEKDFICVHAGVPIDKTNSIISLDKASCEDLVYDRQFKEPSVIPNTEKCIFYGHTPTSYLINKPEIITYPKTNNPSSIKDYYKIHLDLGVWLHGILGCFCVETCKTYYVEKL